MALIDTVIRTLSEQAHKAYSGRKFRFGVSFVAKDSVFLVTMRPEEGDVGAVFYCQGEGPDLEEAARGLAASFITQTERDLAKTRATAEKSKAYFEKAVCDIDEARIALLGLAQKP
jgi:hypothetical protein